MKNAQCTFAHFVEECDLDAIAPIGDMCGEVHLSNLDPRVMLFSVCVVQIRHVRDGGLFNLTTVVVICKQPRSVVCMELVLDHEGGSRRTEGTPLSGDVPRLGR
jgi:hypothetical protein